MAPSTAAATCSGPAKLESSSIAMSRDDFDFRCRKAVPAARRNVAAVNASSLPPPTSSNRRAFSPAGRCSSARSSALPLNSFDSYKSAVSSDNRSLFWPSKATITSASHSIASMGCTSNFVIIRLVCSPRLAGADCFARFGLGRARPLGFAFIVQLLAARHRQLALDAAFFQVDLGRDQRQALLASLAQQLGDLVAMQQQLA